MTSDLNEPSAEQVEPRLPDWAREPSSEEQAQLASNLVAQSKHLLLDIGADLGRIASTWTHSTLLSWRNWDEGLASLDIPSLKYRGCQFSVGYFWYAYRGDPTRPYLSRAWSLMSHWDCFADARDIFSIGNTNRVVVLFPTIDGINFHIGLRRRRVLADETISLEDKNRILSYYSRETEVELACVAARCALGPGLQPGGAQFGASTYMCMMCPGRALDDNGELLETPANAAFVNSLGFKVRQVSLENGRRFSRIYGKVVESDAEGCTRELPFNAKIADAICKIWIGLIEREPRPHRQPETAFY